MQIDNLRAMIGITRSDSIRNERIRVGIWKVNKVINEGRMRWYESSVKEYVDEIEYSNMKCV